MRRKYIEERYPEYFIFGTHKDGRVDLATNNNGTICTVSVEHANKLIADRSELLDVIEFLCSIANQSDFDEYWYGGTK